MLNVTDPAAALLVARLIEKSASVADTPPVSDPLPELLEELLQATAPSSATAAVRIVSRLNN
jgi:hypothetical protein